MVEKFMIDALEIRGELDRSIDMFPNRCCKFAVLNMNKKGYGINQGVIRLDNYCSLGIDKEIVHYWNFDRESGVEFDITASQFNIHLSSERAMSEIEVWKKGENLIYVVNREDISSDWVI
jgi:hypothetical protein